MKHIFCNPPIHIRDKHTHTHTHLKTFIPSPSHTHTHTHTHAEKFLDINTFLHVTTGVGTALTSQDRYTCAPVTL